MASHKKHKKNKRKQRLIIAVIVIVIIIIIIAAIGLATVFNKYSPSKSTSDYASYYGLTSEDEVLVNFDHAILDEKALYMDGEVYIPYDLLHDSLNSRFYWDETENILRYVLPEGVVSADAETASYTVAKESRTFDHIIVHLENGEMYLSLSFIEQYTDIRSSFYEEPSRVVISDEWGEEELTNVKRTASVRELGGVKSDILTTLSKEDTVTVLEELDSWTEVCTEDGFIGYVQNKSLGDTYSQVLDSSFTEPVYTHISRDYTINMAWHQVTNQTANDSVSSVLASASGLNVISPTWFYLNDDSGGIVSLASSDYVSYCHGQGVEVWALVSNLENPDVDTTSVLSVTSSRDALVNNLISEALLYDLDGINVDFESLAGEAGTGFLEFIRELSVKCRGNNLVLSVDNYPPAAYNTFYSRDEQSVFADYIILMAYDEHYSGGEAGSVASLDFVIQSVEDTLTEVPANQLILGVPFYTRLWKLTPEGDSYNTTSEALGMTEAESRVTAAGGTYTWLDDCGQYYSEYEADGCTYEIWMEDQNSIEAKLNVMQAHDLAGASFWKLGYEKSTVWDTIDKFMD